MAPDIVLKPLSPPRDATYTVVADAVQDVINGRLSPATAAANIDAAIMSAERDDVWNPDCLNDDNKSDQGTEEEAERDGGLEGRRTVLLEFLATAAVQVPASHAGQDKLVELLQEIPKLPYRHITMFDGNCGQDTKRGNLWAARHVEDYQDYLKFVESRTFGYIKKWDCLGGHPDSGPYLPPATGPPPSLENFSAFSARLFAAGIFTMQAGCTILRAPFATIDHTKPLPKDYDEHACGAAQWIIYAGAQLFETCELNASWTQGRSTWESWRHNFKAISESDLSDHCRHLAVQAIKTMKEIEEAGVSTNVVYEYGIKIWDGDMLVSTRPEARDFIGKKAEWDEYGQDGQD